MCGTRNSSLLGKITVVVVICFCSFSAQAKYGGGTGEPNDPYLIYTASQMNEIGLNEDDWDKHFKLMADIDLSGFTGTSFNIIGYYVSYYDKKPFTGVFDGDDHTISNFTHTSTDRICIGLFGYIHDPNAEIKNLGLFNPNVDAGTGRLVGSLVGWLHNGTVSACYTEGASVSGMHRISGLVGRNDSTITNCYSTGSISGTGRDVGGLVGANLGTITNCYSKGSVSGDERVGGLAGHNFYATIANCYSNGDVAGGDNVGGLVGKSEGGTISNCYSTGSVSGDECIGGLVGSGDEWRVADSFWDIESSGQITSDGGTGLPTDQMQMQITFTDAGWDFVGETVNGIEDIWFIPQQDYPHLWWEVKYGGGSGTANDPYLIYTAEHMNAIGADSNDWDKHFKLMAEIDLSAYTGTSFNIIGYWVSSEDHNPFTGVFDGNGHTISNFSYTSVDTDNCGLFSYVDESNAEIKDLGLIDPNLDAGTGDYVGSLVGRVSGGAITNCYVEGGSVSGDYYVGGLVGLNLDGTISNCYVTGTVSGFSSAHYGGIGGLVGRNDGTITNSYSSGSISGRDRIGGLVGYNFQGTITNSFSTGSVTGTSDVGGVVGLNRGTISNCYSTGSVSGGDYVGGLVGKNGRCLFYCNPGTISNCYSTGSVSDYSVLYSNVGGLVGYNESGTISTSFWDIDTSGQITSDGGTGLPTDQMQMQITFTDAGWDFVGETVNGIEDIWFIPQQDYPHLWWEGMQVPMKLTPRTLNCRSQGNWVKAHLTLPEGFTVADVDPDRPAVLHSFGFESAPLYVFVNKNKLVEIEAAFERQAVCSLAGDWPQELTVAGFLAEGNIFLGSSTVRIIHPGME